MSKEKLWQTFMKLENCCSRYTETNQHISVLDSSSFIDAALSPQRLQRFVPSLNMSSWKKIYTTCYTTCYRICQNTSTPTVMMALSFLASRVLTSPSTDRRLSLFWVIGLLWLRRMQPPAIYATAQHITSHVVIGTKQTLHIEYHKRTTWMSIYASTEYRRLHFCVSVIYSFIEAVSDTVASILIYSRYKHSFHRFLCSFMEIQAYCSIEMNGVGSRQVVLIKCTDWLIISQAWALL